MKAAVLAAGLGTRLEPADGYLSQAAVAGVEPAPVGAGAGAVGGGGLPSRWR